MTVKVNRFQRREILALLLLGVVLSLMVPVLAWLLRGGEATRGNDILVISYEGYHRASARSEITLGIENDGDLCVREHRRDSGKTAEIFRIKPSNIEKSRSICAIIGSQIGKSGLNSVSTIGPGVRLYGLSGSAFWENCPDLSLGDLWGWIDMEISDLHRIPNKYQAASERTLLLLSELASQYEIPPEIKSRLAKVPE